MYLSKDYSVIDNFVQAFQKHTILSAQSYNIIT